MTRMRRGHRMLYLVFVVVLVATASLQFLLSLGVEIMYSSSSLSLTSSSASSSSSSPPGPWKANYSEEEERSATILIIEATGDRKIVLPQPQDKDCIFRDSPLYRSVYVYPSPGEHEWDEWADQILSETGKSFHSDTHRFPWQPIEERTRRNGEYHFRMRDARAIQYTTELLVRDILTHPDSCLRSQNPETAQLFFVPYMVSMEWHNGTQYPKSFETSPYGQAILDILDQEDYGAWESIWGYTSKYWKRRGGADHILVMSESCHGLSHPRSQSGHDVLIHAQKQMTPPIIITIVTSRTFVTMYPHCAAKNIIVPNPNPDGRWFNSRIDRMAAMIAHNASFETSSSAVLPQDPSHRPLAYYYQAGNHGSCRRLRQQLETTFECSPTGQYLKQQRKVLPKGYHFPHAYRHATFCPCPGGDAPNAKRYFDAVMAGCIPLILTQEFVWPYSAEIPGARHLVQESDISLRLPTQNFLPQGEGGDDNNNNKENKPRKKADCKTAAISSKETIQSYIESISSTEIARLQQHLPQAAAVYSYYQSSPELPDNPLREGVLPNGPAAHALVEALADRAYGQRWPACREEVEEKDPVHKDTVHQFQC